MAVELQWTESSSVISEPFGTANSTTYTFTLKNIGDSAALNVGFYLKPATSLGDIDNPSTDGVLSDWHDVLTKGDTGGSPLPGFRITQGVTATRFSYIIGDSVDNPIPLTVGSGVDGSTIAPGEEVEIELRYNSLAGDPTRRLYVQVDVTYTEVS